MLIVTPQSFVSGEYSNSFKIVRKKGIAESKCNFDVSSNV